LIRIKGPGRPGNVFWYPSTIIGGRIGFLRATSRRLDEDTDREFAFAYAAG